MSDFKTWEKIQEWMQNQLYDSDFDVMTVIFPHPTADDLHITATFVPDWNSAWRFELLLGKQEIIPLADGDFPNLYYEIGDDLIAGLRAFCPYATLVTVMGSDDE